MASVAQVELPADKLDRIRFLMIDDSGIQPTVLAFRIHPKLLKSHAAAGQLFSEDFLVDIALAVIASR